VGKEGIGTPRFVVLLNDPRTRREAIEKLLKMNVFPYIIKPENLGNSKGIDEQSIAWNERELCDALNRVYGIRGGKIIVEQYLGTYRDCKEITCAMIEGPAGMQCMPAAISLVVPKAYHLITTNDKR